MTAIALLVLGCIDYRPARDTDIEGEVHDGSIAGRLCKDSGIAWAADVKVYTHVVDATGDVRATRVVYTDPNGRFLLDELPGDNTYVVFAEELGMLVLQEEVFVASGEQVVLREPSCYEPHARKVAVVTGDYDKAEEVLVALGFRDITFVDGTAPEGSPPQCPQCTVSIADFLDDATLMRQHDMIVFDGGHREEDVVYDSDSRSGGNVPHRLDAIRAFVSTGGTLVATDWAYDVVEQAWPDRLAFLDESDGPNAAQKGARQDALVASLSDESLAQFLGKDAGEGLDLAYRLDVWPVLLATDAATTVHLRAGVTSEEGTTRTFHTNAPLLTSFVEGDGRVVFSTFAFDQNLRPEINRTMQYLLFELD